MNYWWVQIVKYPIVQTRNSVAIRYIEVTYSRQKCITYTNDKSKRGRI